MKIDIKDVPDVTLEKIEKPKTDFDKFLEYYIDKKRIVFYQYQINFMKTIIENRDKRYTIYYPYRSGKSMMQECIKAYLKNLI